MKNKSILRTFDYVNKLVEEAMFTINLVKTTFLFNYFVSITIINELQVYSALYGVGLLS